MEVNKKIQTGREFAAASTEGREKIRMEVLLDIRSLLEEQVRLLRSHSAAEPVDVVLELPKEGA